MYDLTHHYFLTEAWLPMQTRSTAAGTPQPPAAFSLEHMHLYRNKVNMMQTDMPYAVVSTAADPPVHRPDVLVMVPSSSGNLPPRRDLLSAVRELLQGGKLGKHSGYRMEELSHPMSASVKAQALYFYSLEEGSPLPEKMVRHCDS